MSTMEKIKIKLRLKKDFQKSIKDISLKRPAESSAEEQSAKRLRNSSEILELRVLIRSKNAGTIIGRQGKNIKSLRKEFRACVTLPDSSGPERILTICATIENIEGILQKIIPSLEEYKQKSVYSDCELRVLIHHSQAGIVIGIKGDMIRQIRDETQTSVKVFRECCPQSTDRVIMIEGKRESIISCVKVILKLIRKVAVKGYVRKYDANHFNKNFTYGGFSLILPWQDRELDPKLPARARGSPPHQSAQQAPTTSYGLSGFQTFPPDASLVPSNMGGGVVYNSQSYAGLTGSYPSLENAIVSDQCTIPRKLVGSIIGKGGQRISQIRHYTNTWIKINEPLPGSDDRIICITGTRAQIQTAKYLMQSSVKQYSGLYQ